MSAILGSLGKILGLIDGNIDLGAITGIFGRIQSLIERAEGLAKRFRNDPEVMAFLNDVRGLLRLQNGQTITKEEIAALRKHWGEGNAEPVYDRPKKSTPPPPPPPPPPPTGIEFGTVLTGDPGDDKLANGNQVWRSEADHFKFTVSEGKTGSQKPTAFFPEIPGVEEPNWKLFRTVSK